MIKFVTYNKNIDKFVKDLEKRCEKYGITFLMSGLDYVNNDYLKSNGYFDETGKVMATSVGKPVDQWLSTLVHESCHFDQWVQKSKVWNAMSTYKPDACTQLFDYWIASKKKITPEHGMKMAEVMRDVELDCERRTIEKIKKYNLPIKIKDYCKAAGAYAMFYTYMGKHKKWYKIGKEPYNNKKILALMPGNLKGKYDKLTPELEKLFKECV